jgi:hypothetical protein
MAESLQEKLRDELYDAGLDDLSNAIANLKDDDEVRKYMWANRAYFDRNTDKDQLEAAPTMKDLIYNDYTGKKMDFDKQFGKDWDKNFSNIGINKIKYEALKSGQDWRKVLKNMENEATARQQNRVAHGEDLGGWFDSPESFAHNLQGAYMNLMAPRQQEAIARGEDPTLKDQLLDAAQTSLEAMPWGRAVKGAGLVSRYALSNATAPLAMEVADAAAYGDENPRGEFSIGDVAAGVGTNLATPLVVNKGARGAGRILPTGKGQNVAKTLGEFGDLNTTSREDVLDKLAKGQSDLSKKQRTMTRYNKGESVSKEAALDAAGYQRDYKTKFDEIKHKLQKGNWRDLSEDELVFIKKDPELTNWFLSDKNKTRLQLAGEEAVKNFATNKVGDVRAEQGQGMTRIPVAGNYLQGLYNENQKEKLRKKEEQEIIDELRTRGLLMGDR